MSKPSLEERISALGRAVAELQVSAANGVRRKDWRRAIGMFTDNRGMQPGFLKKP